MHALGFIPELTAITLPDVLLRPVTRPVLEVQGSWMRARSIRSSINVLPRTFLEARVWTTLTLLLSLIGTSEEVCEKLKKTTFFFKTESILYRYVACTKMTAKSDVHGEILSALNSTYQYLEIINSTIPTITKGMFQDVSLTQITIDAKVQQIQDKAFERSSIATVILDNNDIQKVEGGAFKSFAIYVLSLKNNSLDKIASDTFSGPVNLRKLVLQHNRVSSIHPDSFNELVGLNELNLDYNKLDALQPGTFSKLRNLQTLFLNNNNLKQLPVNIFSNNTILQYLSLQRNSMSQLDATFFPQSLLYINAAENGLKWFNMSGLVNLNQVVLDSNKVMTIVNCFHNLPALSMLQLSYNSLGISTLNASFGQLPTLSMLEIDNNHLQGVDFSIFKNLAKLNSVSFAGNELTTLDIADTTTSITVLNLSSNSLSEIKNLWKLSKLQKLDLSDNRFLVISFDMLANMSALNELSLRNNSIQTLSLGCFRDLKSLSHLDLSYNSITNISSWIFNGLKTLYKLDISHNNLVFFDEDSFHSTRQMRILNIAYSNISEVNIKRVLSHTIWLREIDLNGNNWTCNMLIDIGKGNNIITFVGGNSFNVSNVHGVPCIEVSDEGKIQAKDLYLPDILEVMNSTMIYTRDISFKLTISNSMVIIFLVLVCLKYIYKKYSSRVTVASQFVYQPTANEQEIQLL